MNKKKEIIPAILEENFLGIEKKKKILIKNFDKKSRNFFVQVDICDGKLTPGKTFGSGGCLESFLKIKKSYKDFLLELDMIVDFREENIPKDRAKKFLKSIKKSGAKRVVFHNQGVNDWKEIFDFFKGLDIEIGLGVWLLEKNSDIEKLLKKYNFKYIQIMGIEKVGFGGQKISKKIFKKAKYFSEKFPKIPVQVDGGVKVENSKELFKNGVSRFVSGSGFFGTKDLKKRKSEF